MVAGWAEEFEQWEAGTVANEVLRWPVFDGELGYVGEEDQPWAIVHMQDGAVTPLLVGTPEWLWERRPQTWRGRAHVPVPAVVLGGVRATFTPVWGRRILGVARCADGRVVLLGIVGEEVGMAVLLPEPMLVFVGRPQEIGTVNLDHLEWLTRPATATARSATTTETNSASRASPPPTSAVRPTPFAVEQHFARVREAMPRASHLRRWTAAAVAEIPQVVDALEQWAREGRGSIKGRKQKIHAELAGRFPDFRASVDGVGAALDALGQVCGGFVTLAARTWEIHMDPAVFRGEVESCPGTASSAGASTPSSSSTGSRGAPGSARSR